MPLTLTLNASEKRIQFLLTQEGSLLCAQDWAAHKGGAELLAPALADACARLEKQPSAIARIACVAGPGSFTGIRLATSTASALARANNAKVLPLHYLEVLAAGLPQPPVPEEHIIHVAVNARRGWYYSGLYILRDGVPQAMTEAALRRADTSMFPEPDAGYLAQARFLLGSAVHSLPEYFHSLSPRAVILPLGWDQPRFDALMALTRCLDWEHATLCDVTPLYLRECDAVDNLDHLARSQGVDPDEAHRRLQKLMRTPLDG